MAALARGGTAVKAGGGGDKKQQVGRSSRLLSVAVGCFLLFVVFALSSSRYNATFGLDDTRRGDFRPSTQGDSSHGAGDGELAQQNHDDKAAAAAVPESESVIREESNNIIVKEAELEEEAELENSATADAAAAAADVTSNSDEQAKPAAEDADPDKDKLRASATGTAAQPVVVQTTSPHHQHPPGNTTRAAAALVNQQWQPLCDLSGSRSDVCDLTGDVRLDANASSFIVVVDPTPTPVDATTNGSTTTTYKVRPYARKGDATSMSRVTEVTVRTTTADAAAAPRCTATHAEPAVVFSIGGYAGNLFHDFTDIIVPLYGTAQRFRGDVRLVVTDAAGPWSLRWLAKYDAVLRGLSRHPPLDLAKAAAAGEVHCFGHVVVGLRANRELMTERDERGSGPEDGIVVGMVDFARFLRRALSLPRDAPTNTRPISSGDGDAVVDTGRSRRRPRLLIIARRGTRRLLNADAMARVAEEVGFDVVLSELEVVGGTSSSSASDDDIADVGRRINSFDAMVGVHGAGLTNMVFLPRGATVVQVVPWGGLQWIARMDFGDPAEAMGLRYVQYEIAMHESSLRDKYPSDHEVFTNPTALHKKGFKFLRHTFLIGQDVTLDVDRFRVVLLQAFQNLTK